MSELGFTPWMLPGVCGLALAVVAGRIAWRSQRAPGGREMLALGAAVAWWCLWQVLVLALPDLSAKVTAARLQYLGAVAAPLCWLWFGLAYASRARRVPGWGWALIAAPEVVTVVLAWTNERHGLFWERAYLDPDASLAALRIEFGAWFWVHVVYAYGLVAVGTGLVAVLLAQSPHQRRRLPVVVAAPVVPLLANSLFYLGGGVTGGLDLTPAGMAVAILLLAWSLLRGEVLTLPPVARGQLVELLPDGIVVADARGWVVDINSAGQRLLGCAPGAPLPGVLRTGEAPLGVADIVEFDGRVVEVLRSPAAGLTRGGVVIVVRDVTEQHRLQGELRRVGHELLRANRELTLLANTDALTGLATRRRFLELLEQELRRAARFHHPVGLLLLDIDRFKQINDVQGHVAGDAVLRLVAETIRETVRDIDLVGRLGGDELAIALPETDEAGTRVTASRLVDAVARRTDGTVTISIGATVTGGGVEVDELVQRADVALYRAKAAGRNRVETLEAGEAAVAEAE